MYIYLGVTSIWLVLFTSITLEVITQEFSHPTFTSLPSQSYIHDVSLL